MKHLSKRDALDYIISGGSVGIRNLKSFVCLSGVEKSCRRAQAAFVGEGNQRTSEQDLPSLCEDQQVNSPICERQRKHHDQLPYQPRVD